MYHHGRASGDDQCTIMEGRVEMTNVPSWKGEWSRHHFIDANNLNLFVMKWP